MTFARARHIAFLVCVNNPLVLTGGVKFGQSEGIPDSGIPERHSFEEISQAFPHRVKSFLFINLINRCVYKVVCDSRYLYWSSSGDDICVSVSQKILQCPFGMSDFLKHHQYFSQRFKLGRNLFR